METYSIIDRSSESTPAGAGLFAAQADNHQRKGLSIADCARRDVEATLQLLADRAQYITGASGAAIALRDGERVLCRASSGSAPELGSSLDLNSGLSGESVRMRTALRCDDAANDSRVNREGCRRLGIASFAVTPIIRNGDVIGIFEIFSGKLRAFQERDMTALERLCEMVNTALDHAASERARPAPFAVHGTRVKTLAAAAGATSAGARVQVVAQSSTLERRPGSSGLPGVVPQSNVQGLGGIGACKNCSFPVSGNRVLCVDCEGKGISPANSDFLSGIGGGAAKRSFKSWILANRYIIGMILISAATIAFALLR